MHTFLKLLIPVVVISLTMSSSSLKTATLYEDDNITELQNLIDLLNDEYNMDITFSLTEAYSQETFDIVKTEQTLRKMIESMEFESEETFTEKQ